MAIKQYAKRQLQIVMRWIRTPPNGMILAGAALLFLSALAGFAAFFSGYAIGRYEIGPFTLAQRAEYKIFGVRFERAAERDKKQDWRAATKQLESIFINLDADIGSVPITREGAGGGLTSFGDVVLLVTHEGSIFAASSGADIVETSILAPENGFSAYQAAAEGPLKDYRHNLEYFRFNDILYYSSGANAGLALSYTEWDGDAGCYRTAVATLPLDPALKDISRVSASPEDWDIIFRTQPCLPPKKEYRALEGHTAGGRLAFKPPATLYLASGDYSWDGVYSEQVLAQGADNDYGKVIEINIEGNSSRPVSLGHRNMQGIAFDRDGQLWTVEHGHRGGDELNRIEDGVNYGWPLETLGTRYNGLPIPNTLSYGRHENFAAPVFAFLPSIAISSLTLVENFHESWDGDLLAGGLNSLSLFRLRIADGRVLFSEKINVGQRVRYVHQHTDGRIVLWTDDEYMVFLSPAKEDSTARFIADYIDNASIDVSLKNKLTAAVEACSQCHSFRPDAHQNAPGLGAIYGAPIGNTSYGAYSDGMRNAAGRWDRQNLTDYLRDPSAVIPETIMPNPGIEDSETLREIVFLLEALSNNNE